ncbi:hypothetical protein RCO27_01110 [Sphingosinicella sp. LHD-64]|uniref:tetratricopeptide repeat protein n=1 Tax=Sphingosinicella sp. LHD-64 TaxID=3072139 RepID=UPI00280F0C1B|nr:hypothetical protein [Sphingosinicella sp. LHD-64]MDQ8754814.1 hypothetical protein [Sphingosinicella sp. LHD-64]
MALLLWVAPAQAEWLRAESANFIVFGNSSESRLRERVELLEDFDRLLRMMTTVNDPPAPTKLHIYLVSGLDDLRLVRPVATGVGGFYAATPNGVAALVDSRAEAGGNEILFHEYAHHFMMRYRPGAYPAWYVEGFAEYFMTARFRPQQVDFGTASRGRAYSITGMPWLSIDRVLFGDSSGLGREQMASFYALSWLAVHYFYSTVERQAALRRYLDGAEGGDPRAVFQRATGLAPDQFDEELRRYIRGRRIVSRRMTREPPAPAPVAVMPLPRAADDLILYEVALRLGIPDETGAAYLPRIRSLAARHAQDPFATRVLAHAELLYGDPAAADRLLDPLIEASPDDAELLYLKGMRYLVAAEKADDNASDERLARQWFGRAHAADGNHFQTLYRYAQSLRGNTNFASENTRNVLLLAHSLAPQVSEIRMNTAALLMSRGEYAEAETLLRPLAADPHNAGIARAAREMRELALTRLRSAGGSETTRAEAPDAE